MAKEKTTTSCGNMNCAAGGGAVYGIGFIGALIYFIQNATSFGNGVLGVLKAIAWPGMFVYYLFQFLQIK